MLGKPRFAAYVVGAVVAASACMLVGCAADTGNGDPQEKTAQTAEKLPGGCVSVWGGSNAMWSTWNNGQCSGGDPSVCDFEAQVRSTIQQYGGSVPYLFGWMIGGDGNYYKGIFVPNLGGDWTDMTSALNNLANQYPWAPVQAQATTYCSMLDTPFPYSQMFITWDPRCPSCSLQ